MGVVAICLETNALVKTEFEERTYGGRTFKCVQKKKELKGFTLGYSKRKRLNID